MTTNKLQRTLSPVTTAGSPEASCEQAWIDLTTTQDVEDWIVRFDSDLQRCINATNPTGYGICFCLGQGGQVFMSTTEGAILLDVTPEAEWVAPVITAATGIEAPRGQMWVLPDDKLTQLVLGLSSLIASTRMVLSHRYKAGKY